MIVKLKAVHGALRSRDGSDAGQAVYVSRRRFLVGSGNDCHLCCPSNLISPHHCEILIKGNRAAIRDLGSQSGTFVNQQRLEGIRELAVGDSLQFGRLEFVVDFEIPPQEKPKPTSRPTTELQPDGGISDWLLEIDELDREERLVTPESRQFKVENVEEEKPQEIPAEQKKAKKKKAPGKLPKTQIIAADSIEAAEAGLKKLFRI